MHLQELLFVLSPKRTLVYLFRVRRNNDHFKTWGADEGMPCIWRLTREDIQPRLGSIHLIIVRCNRSTPKLGVAGTDGCRSGATQVLCREISSGRRRPPSEAQRIRVTGIKE